MLRYKGALQGAGVGNREGERERMKEQTLVERSVSLNTAAGHRPGAREEGGTWLPVSQCDQWILRAMIHEFQLDIFLSCPVIWLCYPEGIFKFIKPRESSVRWSPKNKGVTGCSHV